MFSGLESKTLQDAARVAAEEQAQRRERAVQQAIRARSKNNIHGEAVRLCLLRETNRAVLQVECIHALLVSELYVKILAQFSLQIIILYEKYAMHACCHGIQPKVLVLLTDGRLWHVSAHVPPSPFRSLQLLHL